jgi:hypothetical protein
MKTNLFFILFMLSSVLISAQTVSKSVNVGVAGSLSTLLTADQKNTVTNLTVTGTIDARDIKCMRDELLVLKQIDMSGASIAAYSGTGGTLAANSSYAANQLPEYAFSFSSTSKGKVSLTSVLLPSGLTSMANYSFWECTGLTDIKIPNTVTSLGEGSFKGCTNMTSAILCNSLTKVDNTAFYRCYALTSVIIPGTVTQIGSSSFYLCSNLASISIPNSVKSIGDHAFEGCGWATSIALGSGIENIGTEAFKDCLSITAISINRATGPVINTATFSGMKKWEVLFEVPASRIPNYTSAPGWLEFTNIKEKTFTSLQNLNQTNHITFIPTTNGIMVSNLQDNELIGVYSITGEQVFLARSRGNQQHIQLEKGRIYVIKTKAENLKVSL